MDYSTLLCGAGEIKFPINPINPGKLQRPLMVLSDNRWIEVIRDGIRCGEHEELGVLADRSAREETQLRSGNCRLADPEHYEFIVSARLWRLVQQQLAAHAPDNHDTVSGASGS